MIARPSLFAATMASTLPVAGAVLIAWGVSSSAYVAVADPWEQILEEVTVTQIAEAEQLFAQLEYGWPLPAGSSVPRISVDPLPGDLHESTEVGRRKSVFFRAILPIVLAENLRVAAQREFVRASLDQGVPAQGSAAWQRLAGLAAEYRVAGDMTRPEVRDEWLRRVDVVPTALVLAQAAIESGWGTSRFVRLGNNLFGEWTFKKGSGMVPAGRADGAKHAVRKFPSLRASVRSYIHNLNVGRAYVKFRALRAELRAAGQPIDSLRLVSGLHGYSARGEGYVREVRRIIHSNGLTRLRTAALQ